MKKLISFVIILVIVATAFYGCSSNTVQSTEENTNTTSNVSQLSTDKKEIDISIYPEVKASSENINVYRQEVSKRFASLGENESFITDEDWEAISTSEWLTDSKYRHDIYFATISKMFQETSKYYYPVVYRDSNMLFLWYTTETGSLHFEKIHGYGLPAGGNYGGQVHIDISDEEIITSKYGYTTTYVQETGEFKVRQFGEVVDRYSVPKDSVYCGFSYFEGYIFRNGTDVYALNAVDTHTTDGSVECIAHDVKYVVDADYYFGSDPWCQPLLLMNDGSLKCYVGWEGDENAAPDDTSHLCDLQFEGSYDK